MIKYIFLLFPISVYCQDTAKYCFTPKEMDFWIGQTIDAKTDKNATDSLFCVIDSMTQDKDDLRALNKSCEELNKDYKKVFKRNKRIVYLWQSVSALIGSAWVVREVKRLY